VIALLSAFGAGLLFGAGLWLSGLAHPQKVLGFLDVAGDWDPSLLLMMAGAVAVTLAAFRPTLRRGAPWLAPRFELPDRKAIDGRLVLGAAIFGAGWGLGGYCPGPALTALANLSLEPVVFVAAMIAGGLVHGIAFSRSSAAAAEPVKPWFESGAAGAGKDAGRR
jgi:uncharacterized membrane protein YedE/YeeE